MGAKVSEKSSASIFIAWLLDYIVKTEEADSSEILVLVYRTTWRDMQDYVIWDEL